MIRSLVKSVLRVTHLLSTARRVSEWLAIALNPVAWQRNKEIRREFEELRRCHGEALATRLNAGIRGNKKVLVLSAGSVQTMGTEIGLIKGLQMAGFAPLVVSPPDRWLIRYYEAAGVEKVLFWEDFGTWPSWDRAEKMLSGVSSLPDLLEYEHRNARVGRFTASTALRSLRLGSLNLESRDVHRLLVPFLASALAHAEAANRLIQRTAPELALFVDRGYTPAGELFDNCLVNNVDVVSWNAAHKNNAIMLKRYTSSNRNEHPASLSDMSWNLVRHMEWTQSRQRRLNMELRNCYASGNWYTEVGTQFHAHMIEPTIVRERLQLDCGRKTAAIFPHILWDGTFFYGRDLFGSYESWFVETVRTACANSEVTWLIKVHPGNLVKNVRDGVGGEPSEIKVIRDRIGRLPAHVRMIPPDSDVSTFSLYSVIDYCVTVRGTIGIEAATFGIPVLTAGTGRYNDKGFTIDSKSKEEYLERIAQIHEIRALSAEQQELAERFAFGIFLLRPLLLKTVTLEYQKDARATPKATINALTKDDWLNAPDLRAFAEWVADGKQTDFLNVDAISLVGG